MWCSINIGIQYSLSIIIIIQMMTKFTSERNCLLCDNYNIISMEVFFSFLNVSVRIHETEISFSTDINDVI